MKEADAKARIDELRAEIEKHDYHYYVLDDPIVPDAEYDRLMRELQALEKDFPDLVTDDSPSQRVSGQPMEGFEEVRHRTPMLSLANAFSEEEIRQFHDRVLKGLEVEHVDYVAEPKLDGVAISLRYENGRLAQAAHDGLARSIRPAHGLTDGDTIFGLATGAAEIPPPGIERVRVLNSILGAAADVFAAACTHAVLSASTVGDAPAWRELCPRTLDAC